MGSTDIWPTRIVALKIHDHIKKLQNSLWQEKNKKPKTNKPRNIFINTSFSNKPGLFGTTTACEADWGKVAREAAREARGWEGLAGRRAEEAGWAGRRSATWAWGGWCAGAGTGAVCAGCGSGSCEEAGEALRSGETAGKGNVMVLITLWPGRVRKSRYVHRQKLLPKL